MKKILFLLKVPPPVHGSTLMNQSVSQSQLLRNRFDCSFFPLSLSRDIQQVGKLSWRKMALTGRDYVRLFRTLRKIKPDLVYFALTPTGKALLKDFLFYRIIRVFRIPVVFHHHGRPAGTAGRQNRLYRSIYYRMIAPNENICLAPELAAELGRGLKREPFVVPNGIGHREAISPAPKPPDRPCEILYLSNFFASKGVLDVIEAARWLREKGIEFHISLIGNGRDLTEQQLRSRVQELDLDPWVSVEGPKYGAEKARAYETADFFVFPTKYERELFPLVILEAMQSGLPVISTPIGAIPSMIEDGKQGFLVPAGEIPRLAASMARLIGDRLQIGAMGRKAREKFESLYTLDAFEARLADTLDEVFARQNQLQPSIA